MLRQNRPIKTNYENTSDTADALHLFEIKIMQLFRFQGGEYG